MRKVSCGCACSLDNYIARDDGSVDWLLWCDEAAEIMKDYWPKVGTIVMGRKTYDTAMQSMVNSRKRANPYGNVETFVFSRSHKSGEHDGVTFTTNDPGKFVGKLKQMDGGEICVMGGGIIVQALLEAGVIDEIGLNVHPLLLGSGIPLFHPLKSPLKRSRKCLASLELLESRVMKNGCVFLNYRIA